MNQRIDAWQQQAEALVEVLPFMRHYEKKTVVIKYGGSALTHPSLARGFAGDVVMLRQGGARVVVVHGGGPQIDETLARMNMRSEFQDGLRITTKETMPVVEMVLAGSLNKAITAAITDAGGRAVGLSGMDGELLQGTVNNPDLGLVGNVTHVQPQVLTVMLDAGFIPVVAPVARTADGTTCNINADEVAGALAAHLHAERLLMLTDVAGVLDEKGNLCVDLKLAQAEAMMREGHIVGGMVPKVKTCVGAVRAGVKAAAILDGRARHALLVELYTREGAGTLLEADT